MGVNIPSIKATLSDREYRLITSVAGQNFGEALRLPDAALWLEEAHRPESFEDAEAERTASEQVCLHFVPGFGQQSFSVSGSVIGLLP